MSVSIDPPDSPPPGVVIAEVAQLLGVPMPTLRSWEIRYGIPDAPHAFGRHRRYAPEQLRALRLMRNEIARGQRAGQAAQTVRHMLTDQGSGAYAVQHILTQARQLDSPALAASFDDAAARLGVGRSIDEVLLPALRQVDSWSDAASGSAEEFVMTDAVRGWLSRRTVYAPPPPQGPPVLLACGPIDEHTIGGEALALLLRLAGWPCRILGPHIATSDLVVATTSKNPAAVVVVSHLASARRQAIASIRTVDRLDIAVFYAGNAFTHTRARRALPGTYLGTNLQAACALIQDALTAPTLTRDRPHRAARAIAR